MTLLALLDSNLQFDAEYGSGLANHLPMALLALHARGAPDARLDAFASHYARRLAPARSRPAAAWPEGEHWTSKFGRPESWAAYRGLFAGWLAQDGREAVLTRVLPALMPGCGAAAFHGLIRTAHALSSGHCGELAAGLAYWACRYWPINVPAGAGAGDSDAPAAVIASMRRALGGWCAEGDLIVQRMQAAVAQPIFAPEARRLRVDESSLTPLAMLANRLYADGGNFTVLHLVTGCHSLRLLLPYFAAPASAVRSYWWAYAAAATGLPAAAFATTPRPIAALAWPEIVARAIASDNEHVVKLVYSAREEYLHYGRAECHDAAARAVATI